MQSKEKNRVRRKKRIRSKIKGTAKVPRLCVFRSNTAIYAQLVDDVSGKTMVAYDSRKLKSKKFGIEKAAKVGQEIAKLAQSKKIQAVVFDKNGYNYHGKVKALAEGARKSGLKF
ncbi:MAG: 50S ribosomal protein L18 [Candidatus Moranbacteria bacterium]|jgi:large subunit ribosomal protein L18|nr:50S ribosomal protein L18 [Candidatus Moranbacteria bacterium]